MTENYYADGRNAGCDIFDVSGKDASGPRSLEAGRKFLVERVEEFQYEDLEHTTVSTSQWDNSSDANYILSEILSDGSKIKKMWILASKIFVITSESRSGIIVEILASRQAPRLNCGIIWYTRFV